LGRDAKAALRRGKRWRSMCGGWSRGPHRALTRRAWEEDDRGVSPHLAKVYVPGEEVGRMDACPERELLGFSLLFSHRFLLEKE
jgi:hypothetical protein